MYNDKSSKYNGNPKLNIEILNNGIAINTAGTRPNNVLKSAVDVNAQMTQLDRRGETIKFIKFLLQISSKNNILKLILDLNKKS